MIHGEKEAKDAEAAARKLFSGGQGDAEIPSVDLKREELADGLDILTLLEIAKLIPTRSEGRRLIKQGGILVNGEKLEDFKAVFAEEDFKENRLMLKKGKKIFKQVTLVE